MKPDPDPDQAKTYHVISVVWGREYLDLFLNTCLPNQLGEGNVPALPAGSRYRILTRTADLDFVEGHATVHALRSRIPVDVVAVAALEAANQPEAADTHGRSADSLPGLDNRFELATEGNRRAIRDAFDAGAALIFPSPDHILSANAFASAVKRHQEGYRAVVCTGMRLQKSEFVQAVCELGRPLGAPAPRELVRMAMPYLHEHTRSMFAEARRFNTYPLGVYWPVGDQGLLARCFHFFPLLLDPMNRHVMPELTIDAGYVTQACPDLGRVHVVTDSDELVVFELTDATRPVELSSGSGVALRRAVAIAMRSDDFGLEYWRRYPVRIHSGDLDERWAAIGAEAETFVRAVLWRCRPFGIQSHRGAALIERTRQLYDRYRLAWRRRLPRVRLKQVLRPLRLAQSRASKRLRKTTRQILRRVSTLTA